MVTIRYILSALAVASSVAAQCSVGITTVTATSQSIPCTTLSGSVAIATDISGMVQIDGIQVITGNLSAQNNAALSGIEANDLQAIGGLALGNLTTLSSLNMPLLSQVNVVNFTALPELQTMSFGTTIQKAVSILITNTQLTTLTGINVSSVDTFNINNNPALTTIDMQLTVLTGPLVIEGNGYGHNITASFVDLITAQNMTFRNCTEVLLPSLANVSQDLGFYGNSFQTFSAPNLTTAGGLIFNDNVDLTNISLPSLTSINATYQIANNTQLKVIDGFQKLSVIRGALDFSGNFTNVTLPSLTDVAGGFNMQTSGQFDCSPFQAYKSNQVIKGTYVCSGSESKPGTAGTTPSSTSTSTSTAKKGAAGQIQVNVFTMVGVPALMCGISFVAGLLRLVL